MKLEINISKKHLYYLAAFVVFVFITAIAIAQTSAPNPGHAAGEIGEGTIAGTLTIAGGNVGVGTSPLNRFDVNGAIGIRQQKSFDVDGTTNRLGFFTGADENMVITNEGKVGIGTTGPIGLLDLSGQTSSDIVFSDKQWWGGVSNPRGRIYSAIDSDQWAGSRLTLQSISGSGSSYSFIDTISLKNGNVGIGTTTPSSKLEVAQAGYSTMFTANAMQFNRIDNGGSYIDKMDTGDLRFRFGPSYTDRVIFKNDGNVGIGTISPADKLHISSSGDTGFRITGAKTGSDGEYGYIYGVNSAGNVASAISFRRIGADTSSGISFYTANAGSESEKMRINPDGNVGIGTTSPAKNLHIKGDAGVGIRIEETGWQDWDIIATHGGSATRLDFARSNGATTIMSIMEVSGGGNIGIGTTSPAEKLEINKGNIKLTRTTSGGKEGMVILASSVAKPACDATTAGSIAYEITGAGGTNSHFFGCRIDINGAYQWAQLDN